jgi:hypothetical protein
VELLYSNQAYAGSMFKNLEKGNDFCFFDTFELLNFRLTSALEFGNFTIAARSNRLLSLPKWKTTTRNNNNNNNNLMTIRIQIKRNRRTVAGTTILHPRPHLNRKILFMTMYVPFVLTMYQ